MIKRSSRKVRQPKLFNQGYVIFNVGSSAV